MGYYINPPDMTKEEFLQKYGQVLLIAPPPISFEDYPNKLPVCLVDNPAMGFTAAGICYDKRELEAFTQPEDYRPKKWFLVDRELLKPYYDR